MTKYDGPFYVKKENGEYEYSDICKECAFGDEKSNICALSSCTYLWAVGESEKENG